MVREREEMEILLQGLKETGAPGDVKCFATQS